MKKLLFLAMLLIGAIGAKAEGDQIAGALKVAADKQTATLHVSLTNSATYVAFQMDVTLPEGWTVTSAAPVANATRLTQTSTEGKAGQIGDVKFNLAYNVIDGNKLRVLAYNLANAAIAGNSGDELFTVELTKTSEGTPTTVTEWTASFDNVLFVSKDQADLAEVELSGAAVTGESATLLGDVNSDGKVNTLDVAAAINIVLGRSTTGLNIEAANVNGDKVVNTLDVAAIIQMTLK